MMTDDEHRAFLLADCATAAPALYEHECEPCCGTGEERHCIDGLHSETLRCETCDGVGHWLVDEDGERVEADSHVAE